MTSTRLSRRLTTGMATRRLPDAALSHFKVRTLTAMAGSQRRGDRAAGARLRYAQETQRAAAVTSRISCTSSRRIIWSSTASPFAISSWLNRSRRRGVRFSSDRRDGDGHGRASASFLVATSVVKRGEVERVRSAVQDLFASADAARHVARAFERGFRILTRDRAYQSRLGATPRDLCAMLRSLDQVPAIREALVRLESSLLEVLAENTDDFRTSVR